MEYFGVLGNFGVQHEFQQGGVILVSMLRSRSSSSHPISFMSTPVLGTVARTRRRICAHTKHYPISSFKSPGLPEAGPGFTGVFGVLAGPGGGARDREGQASR